jgi:hypothetical protein
VTGARITLLVEDFDSLVRAADPVQRYPALEQVLSKGRSHRIESITANHLRFSLFGCDAEKTVPVAALTHLSDRTTRRQGDYYWLRADLVTMQAGMAQVFMISDGFADLSADERKVVECCVQEVFSQEEIKADTNHPGRWCMALSEPLDFQFLSLEQALGMDVAEALPGHPGALPWKRLLNEVQIALHNCPVNIRRRQNGQQEINSVWFWGGGTMPESSAQNPIESVYSEQPVTRGLAIINNCRLKAQTQADLDDMSQAGQSMLIDWLPETVSAKAELDRLEILASDLLNRVRIAGASLTLLNGSGRGWFYDRGARRRFWKRTAPLTSLPFEAVSS